jgi:hypothetical protein
MGKMMIDNLMEGMTMSNDILDRSGRQLLGAGATLNDRHLRMLRTWGILEADIIDSPPGTALPVDTEIETQQLQTLADELRPLFRNNNLAHPAMGELFRLCLLRKYSHASA